MRSRLIRFLGSGVVNTAFGYLVFAALVVLNVPAQLALLLQFTLCVLWNFRIHQRYVFGVQGYGRLPYYASSYVLIYFVNAVLLHWLMQAGLDAYLAQAIALGPIVVMSYLLISWALQVRAFGEDPS